MGVGYGLTHGNGAASEVTRIHACLSRMLTASYNACHDMHKDTWCLGLWEKLTSCNLLAHPRLRSGINGLGSYKQYNLPYAFGNNALGSLHPGAPYDAE